MSALGLNSGDATYQVRSVLHRRRANLAATLAILVSATPVLSTDAAARSQPDRTSSPAIVPLAATSTSTLAEMRAARDWQATRTSRMIAVTPTPSASFSSTASADPAPMRTKRSPRPPRAPVHMAPVHIAASSGSAAATVVSFALAQVGKPYAFATDGPDSYDCSGLAKAAYAQVGISIPHQTDGIIGRGHTVDRSELEPGDLVFWPGHVAIYIADGRVVEAANSRTGVIARPIWGNPTAYRRLL